MRFEENVAGGARPTGEARRSDGRAGFTWHGFSTRAERAPRRTTRPETETPARVENRCHGEAARRPCACGGPTIGALLRACLRRRLVVQAFQPARAGAGWKACTTTALLELLKLTRSAVGRAL